MNHRPATTPIHEIMTHAPVTVTTHTTVGDLVALFDRHDFNAFPVVDEHGALRGIVSKLDVLRLFRPDASFRIPDFATISSVRVEPGRSVAAAEVRDGGGAGSYPEVTR